MIKRATVLILALAAVLVLSTSVLAEQGAKGGGPPAAKAPPASGATRPAGKAATPAPAQGATAAVGAAAAEQAKLKAQLDSFIMPTTVELIDYPNDDGRSLALKFPKSPSESPDFTYAVYVSKSAGGPWYKAASVTSTSGKILMSANRSDFGWPEDADKIHIIQVELAKIKIGEEVLKRPDGSPQKNLAGKPIEKDIMLWDKGTRPGTVFYVRLVVANKGGERQVGPVLSGVPIEQWVDWPKANNFIFSVIFCAVVLAFIGYARRNPNLFIRKISGLDAVEEAVGRATEMGKPILYLNGMDAIGSLNTLASVNILGRVARKVAEYDSKLIVPCRDPIVMTVCQEVVQGAYTDAGRPDAYREDSIWYVTMEQFAYVAAISGIMLREKPAANFFFGGYYAESLLLAETGFASGAIQIAGTDALPQLPFFITTCDYTLIGEELYAASAYLAREPRLLGSLRGQDIGKMFILVVVIVGTILSSIGVVWLDHMLVTK
jgi:hypothetical protein